MGELPLMTENGSFVINGTEPRTWLRELRYDRSDRSVLVLALMIFVAITIASVLGLTKLWVFPPLLTLAAGRL